MLGSKRFQRAGLIVLLASMFAAPAMAGTMVAFDDKHYCLENRQKFIALRGFRYNCDDNVLDPGYFTYTITDEPDHGTLLRTDPDDSNGDGVEREYAYVYIPDEDWTGTDTFEYEVSFGGESDTGDVSIVVESSYTPPYGIAAPGFGITEEANTIYASSGYSNDGHGNVFTSYVDADHPSATDTFNFYGTLSTPRKTLPTIYPLPAGTVILVKSYNETVTTSRTIAVWAGGSSSTPVFIRGVPYESGYQTEKPVIKHPLKIESNYIIIENIDFDASDANLTSGIKWINVSEKVLTTDPYTWATFNHIAIRHCLFRDFPTGATTSVGAISFYIDHGTNSPDNATDLTEDCVAYDIEVRDFGDWLAEGSIDYYGCGMGINSKDCWCLDSHLHYIESTGVGVHRSNALDDQAPPQNISIGRNYMHHMKEGPIQVKHAIKGFISQNKMWRSRKSDSGWGHGILVSNFDATEAYPYTDNLWLMFNEIYDCQRGISVYPVERVVDGSEDLVTGNARVFVIGNIIHHIQNYYESSYKTRFGQSELSFNGNTGFALMQGAMFQCIYLNNTIYKCNKGLGVICWPLWNDFPEEYDTVGTFTSTIFQNNVVLSPIVEPFAGIYDFDVCRLEILNATNIAFDFTLHWPSSTINIDIVGETGTPYSSVSALQSNTIFGTYSIEDDPDFADVTMLDFHPTNTSPCRNAGTDLGTFSDFNSTYGGTGNIQRDFDGNIFDDSKVPIGALIYPLEPQ